MSIRSRRSGRVADVVPSLLFVLVFVWLTYTGRLQV